MVAKLAFVLLVLAVVLIAAVIAAYRYFDNRATENHEKEMFREQRDAELLTGQDSIDQQLEEERNS
jgi:predicted negative regulator of RcsB-dependent stress response